MCTFTVTVVDDPVTGDLILPFPDKLLRKVDWHPGDTVCFKNNGDGTYTLTKKVEDDEV